VKNNDNNKFIFNTLALKMKIFSTRGTLTKTTPPGKKKAAAQAAAQCGKYIYQLPSPERGTPPP
jgi:hypothetical protein